MAGLAVEGGVVDRAAGAVERGVVLAALTAAPLAGCFF
jgi:hypothetical protein